MLVLTMTHLRTPPRRRRGIAYAVLLGVLAALLLQGCSPKPKALRLPVAVEESFVGTDPNASPTQPPQNNWAEKKGGSDRRVQVRS